MSSVAEHLAKKLREQRAAKEKARIEKLRELNLKKYNKFEPQQPKNFSSTTSMTKNEKPNTINKEKPHVKNNFHVNNTTKRPITMPPVTKKFPAKETKPTVSIMKPKTYSAPIPSTSKVTNHTKPDLIPKLSDSKMAGGDTKKISTLNSNKTPRKSFAPVTIVTSRKSTIPKPETKSIVPKVDTNSTHRESVFERLYKPKMVVTKPIDNKTKLQTGTNNFKKVFKDNVTQLQTDPNYFKKVLKGSGIILNKRHTVFEFKSNEAPVRRSISAVHFKRINKSEINNCIHKWASIGDKMNKAHLNDINEDETVKQDRIVSAIKSERKRVKFLTPVQLNLTTPKPEELQARLKNWLQKRGKSLDSYHHLQCFGIHHIAQRQVLPIEPLKFDDDENKENIALEHDSDNDSYEENMNNKCEKDTKWRSASYNDSVDMNDTQNSTLSSCDMPQQVDEVLLGALNDLTELLKEGFDWEQCARWLRAIRERFPFAPDTAAYWECRAALEETRGDLPASVQCWEEAIAKGTERSVVESNLDQLLDKFMQLKISPNSGKKKPVDSKMVDVKNVFKSTIIRFAVQQAKLRRSSQLDLPKYTVTPVRRSSRLSSNWSSKRPLQECSSVKQASKLAPVQFVPNPTLFLTP